MSRFVIRRVSSGVKFDLYAANGQSVASSEVYDSPAACRKGIESVRKNAGAKIEVLGEGQTLSNPKYEVYQDRAGDYRFRLRSRNGKIIAVSESYAAKAGCLDGIESVKRNAPTAEVAEK